MKSESDHYVHYNYNIKFFDVKAAKIIHLFKFLLKEIINYKKNIEGNRDDAWLVKLHPHMSHPTDKSVFVADPIKVKYFAELLREHLLASYT